jgi:hypothetical protein
VNSSTDPENQPAFERQDIDKLNEMRLKRVSPKPDGRNAYKQLQILVTERLSAYIDSEQENIEGIELRSVLLGKFNEFLIEERIVLNRSERRKLIEDVLSEVLGPDSQTNVDRSSKS